MIQYNGQFWHPKNLEEQNKNPYYKNNVKNVFEEHTRKIDFVKNQNWKVLEIESKDSWSYNWDKIINFLNENNIKTHES